MFYGTYLNMKCFLSLVLGMEPRALHVLSKGSTTEMCVQFQNILLQEKHFNVSEELPLGRDCAPWKVLFWICYTEVTFFRKFFPCTLFSFGPALELFTFLSKQKESMEKKYICNIILWSCVRLLCHFAAVNEDNSTITASTQITFLYSLIETNFSNCIQNSQYFKQA